MVIELDSDTELKREEMKKIIHFHCTHIKADFQKSFDKFKHLCQLIKDAGYPPDEAWDCIREELKDIVPKSTLYRWSDEVLPPESKAVTRPKEIPKMGISSVPTLEQNFNTQGMGVVITEEEESAAAEMAANPVSIVEEETRTITTPPTYDDLKHTLERVQKDKQILINRIHKLEAELQEHKQPLGHDALYNRIDILQRENKRLRQELEELKGTTNTTASPEVEQPSQQQGWLLEK